MKIQLWRNATIKLTMNGTNFLIDPMLGSKGSFGEFPWTEDGKKNPIVDLPFSSQQLEKELEEIDVVIVSHLHPDHWDETAIKLLNKNIPLICPEEIVPAIQSYGFRNISKIINTLRYNDIEINLTEGKHGVGEIGDKMGKVNGFVFKFKSDTVYIAGDTVWCEDVKNAIDQYRPQNIIVAGGAATFAFGNPVTMTFVDIKELSAYTPESEILVTHLEAISPCQEDRGFINDAVKSNNLQNKCFVLNDGEIIELN